MLNKLPNITLYSLRMGNKVVVKQQSVVEMMSSFVCIEKNKDMQYLKCTVQLYAILNIRVGLVKNIDCDDELIITSKKHL